MNKPTIDEVLAPKPDARPRIYAYAISDAAHHGLLKVGQTTRDVKRRVAEQLKAFQRATNHGHLITGYDDNAFMTRVPTRVHDNDRHLIAAALVMINGLDEEVDPAQHKVMIVSDNTKHLAVADTRKLDIEAIKTGAFVDRLFAAAPARVSRAIAKSLSDLTKPPYTLAELVAALRLHGAKATAEGLKQVAG
jgi:hypothetical protein